MTKRDKQFEEYAAEHRPSRIECVGGPMDGGFAERGVGPYGVFCPNHIHWYRYRAWKNRKTGEFKERWVYCGTGGMHGPKD